MKRSAVRGFWLLSFRFAEDHNWKQLRNASIDYIEKNFPKICNEDEIYELDKEEFINFLRSENLKIELEYEIFQAAIRWITHNLLERRQYVFEILRHVRLPLISPGELPYTTTYNKLIQCAILVRFIREIDSAMYWRQLKNCPEVSTLWSFDAEGLPGAFGCETKEMCQKRHLRNRRI